VSELKSNRFEVVRRYLPFSRPARKLDATGNRMRIKDWITLTLSILAFLVSAGTAYFNLVRREDNVSVVASSEPFAVRMDKERLVVKSHGQTRISFINSGTRPAVILQVMLLYTQRRLTGRDECEFDQSIWLMTDLEPVVVKQNEVVTRIVNLTNGPWYENQKIKREDDGQFSFPIDEQHKESDVFPMEICLQAHLVTPSTVVYRNKSTFRYSVQGLGRWFWSFDGEGPTSQKPHLLLQESGTIFR
jgi:hypothetical protein